MGALHSEILSKHLAKRVFQAMMDPDSPPWLYEPKLADLVAKPKKLPKKDPKPPKPDEDPTLPANTDPDSESPTMLEKLKLMLAAKTGGDPPNP